MRETLLEKESGVSYLRVLRPIEEELSALMRWRSIRNRARLYTAKLGSNFKTSVIYYFLRL